MGFPGLRFLHPFDTYRARRAYLELAPQLKLPGSSMVELFWPEGPVTDKELELVHTAEYLHSLRRPSVLAAAVEVWPLALTGRTFLNWILVTPMRWAVSGTLVGARQALRTGLAFSLTGGFHHAKPDRGEGFCLFNDIAFAIRTLRLESVIYVDLDAHQGNGVGHIFAGDSSVKIFDVFNGDIYPYGEELARARADACFPLRYGSSGEDYMALVERELPPFLDTHEGAELLIYNAGNDVVSGDRLGGLRVSEEQVLARDLFVIGEARRRGLPLLYLPSGGYTPNSYKMIARTVMAALAI